MAGNQGGKGSRRLYYVRDDAGIKIAIILPQFVLEQKYKTSVSDGYEVDSIVKNISLIDPNKKFVEGKKLIFFDELQEFPDIATALKAFQMDGRYDVICSGSLLGLNYKKIHSNSVGYKTDYEGDIRKYAEGLDQTKIISVYRSVPVQLAKENKKFKLQ